MADSSLSSYNTHSYFCLLTLINTRVDSRKLKAAAYWGLEPRKGDGQAKPIGIEYDSAGLYT